MTEVQAVPDNWSIDSETSLAIVSFRARKVELAWPDMADCRRDRPGQDDVGLQM